MRARLRGAREALFLAFLLAGPAGAASLEVTAPETFAGHAVGADGRLFGWETVVRYARHVAERSPRIRVIELGQSTRGRPFLLVVAGDSAAVAGADAHRETVRRLADPHGTSEEAAREASGRGKVIVLFTLNIHSVEIASSQESVELLYELAVSEEPWMKHVRENVLLLIIPSMNPDGMDLIVDWYERTKGTPAEGSYPIELYHPYAGHDNNRDGFFNNLAETAHLSRVMYHDWLPQVILDQHQMGSNGPRLFLPPFDDPVSETVHPLVYSQLSAASQQMVSDLHAKGWRGIVTQSQFTAEWPGSVRSTGFWHHVLGILSEVASVRIATPMYFPPGSLMPSGRGLTEYERRSNFLDPWPGGWWRLRDIIDIEKDLSWSLLKWCADHRQELLFNFYRMNRDAVRRGESEAPFGFAWSIGSQHDPAAGRRLVEILQAGGVRIGSLSGPVEVEGRRYTGDVAVLSCAQPYRPFVLEMMGASPYPTVRETAGGSIVPPYDVTAWSLPDFLGVEVQTLKRPIGFSLQEIPPKPSGLLIRRGDPEADGSVRRAAAYVVSPRANASHTLALRFLARGGQVRRVLAGKPVRKAEARPGTVTQDRVAGEPSHPAPAASGSLEPGSWILLPGAMKTDLENHATQAARETEVDIEPLASLPPESLLVPIRIPRVGLYSPWGGSMDEGWTRLILERYEIPYTTVRNEDIRGPADLKDKDASPPPRPLRQRFDVIVFPDVEAGILEKGTQPKVPANVHEPLWAAEHRGGLGKERSVEQLKTFVNEGGTLVALDAACDYVIEHLGLPARPALKGKSRDEIDAPGTLVRLEVDPDEPVAFGMPWEAAAWFASSRAFEPMAWTRATGVPARYATDADRIRVAGYIRGPEHLSGKAACLDIPLGRGNVVLFGFKPQNRAQTEATFKFLFNALLNPPQNR